MKKIVSLITIAMLSFGLMGTSRAGGSANFYQVNEPIDVFNVHLNLPERTVYMSWNAYHGDEEFVDYVILRSLNESLQYPDDYNAYGLRFTTDVSETTYVDDNPLEGSDKTRYKLCTVTKKGPPTDGKMNLNVQCSDAMYVINDPNDDRACLSMSQREQYALNDETGECKRFDNPCDIPDGRTAIKGRLEEPACQDVINGTTRAPIVHPEVIRAPIVVSPKLQKKLDRFLHILFAKIEKKNKTASTRAKALQGFVHKLERMKSAIKKDNIKNIIDYLIFKIQEKISDYNDEIDLSDIYNLLNNY